MIRIQQKAASFCIPVVLLLTSSPESALAGDGVAFATDFEAGVPPQFSGVTTLEATQGYAGITPAAGAFGGAFLRNDSWPAQSTRLTLEGLPPHTSLDLGFLLAIIDTWDGDFSVPGAPVADLFNVRVDGALVFSHSLSNWNGTLVQSYVPPPGVLVTPYPLGDLGFQPRTDFGDAAYDMSREPSFSGIAHSAPSLTVEWFASGDGWQGGLDESWALDTVRVVLHGSAPAVPALGEGPLCAVLAGMMLLLVSGGVSARAPRQRKNWGA